MKKTFVAIFLFSALAINAQDSLKVTVAVQARDLDQVSSKIYNNYSQQEVFDSLKAKYRIANPASGITTVNITAYTIDWIQLFQIINNDIVAVKGGTAGRLAALLKGAGQVYLNNRIDTILSADTAQVIQERAIGRLKARRQ
jgi:hypothetical protein